MKKARIDLSDYDISVDRGFLARKIAPLKGSFEPWEKVLSSLPVQIQEKSLQTTIKALPGVEFNESTLKNLQEWRRAYVLLSFLAQGYLRMDDELPEMLPEKLSKPWVAVSEHLGLQPFVSYAAVILYNYDSIDGTKPVEIGNISICNSFTGLGDESWFYIVHVAAEMAAVPGLNAIADAYDHMACKDYNAVSKCLENLGKAVEKMEEAASQMFMKIQGTSNCDPDTFYIKLRPFFAMLPKGIVYEGTGSHERQYHGASAAQTSTIYAFDIFLGMQHSGEGGEFIKEIRDYMPHGHRKFLEKLESLPSVREFCKDSRDEALISSYNKAVDSILSFRNYHLKKLIGEYIFGPKLRVDMSQDKKSNLEDERGTGGTRLSVFLKKIAKETEQLKI